MLIILERQTLDKHFKRVDDFESYIDSFVQQRLNVVARLNQHKKNVFGSFQQKAKQTAIESIYNCILLFNDAERKNFILKN